MINKQAILIMCHNDFYILEKSLELLDNENFDFYIHVDSKVNDFEYEKYKNIIKKGNLFYTDRIDVSWGAYSQIEAELLLIKTALNNGEYLYLHLISGSDLPIKKSDEIANYFKANYPLEFIGYNDFDYINDYMESRVKYFHFIGPNYRFSEEERILHNNYIYLQKRLGVNRLENKIPVRVGANWFSITSNLAKYVLSKEDLIKDMFSYGLCADELFLQSIVYSSPYFKNVCRKYENDNENCKRLIDWERGNPYVFRKEDYNMIMNSNTMFARKFSTTVDKEIIDLIFEKLKN